MDFARSPSHLTDRRNSGESHYETLRSLVLKRVLYYISSTDFKTETVVIYPIFNPFKFRLLRSIGVVIVSLGIFGLFNIAPCYGIVLHDTPDGEVELAVAVVVRGREITITYQVGISPKTTVDQLAAWEIPGLAEAGDDDEKLAQLFCEALETHLLEGLVVMADEAELEIAVIEVAPFAMHHKAAVVKISAELPESENEIELVVSDSNWAEMPGGARYAIKAGGNALLIGSNAAPIVIRATRVDLGELEPEERAENCTLRATVQLVPQNGN